MGIGARLHELVPADRTSSSPTRGQRTGRPDRSPPTQRRSRRRACRSTRTPGPPAQPALGATRRGHSLYLIRHRAGPRSDPASRAPPSHPRAGDADRPERPPPRSPARQPHGTGRSALNTEPRVCAARRRRAGDPAQDAACAQTTLCDRSWPRLTIPIRLRLVRVGETAPGLATAVHNGGHSARHEQVVRQTPWPASSPFRGSLLVVEVGCPD